MLPTSESQRNSFKLPLAYSVSIDTREMIDQQDYIADLHWEALPWGTELTKKGKCGRVDFLRFREANVASAMFTNISKSLASQNIHSNSSGAFDNINPLKLAKVKLPAPWSSLINRTLLQSTQLSDLIGEEDGKAILEKKKGLLYIS